jgi:L-cysteine:1D-myo-inositol 2-amino-2-deoxy-alpha-D-glucopyranoside ligase
MRSWTAVAVNDLSKAFEFPQLRLTDSASTLKKPLSQKDLYRLYVCGITPYDATHLGHAATYLSFDLIHRYLVASGSTVNYVQNITDIDEPLLERANRDGVKWENLATEQIELFRDDMSALNVLPPTHYIGAIEAIPLVIEAINHLSDKKSTYQIDQDIYFSVKDDSKFASISHLKDQEMVEIFSQRGGDPTLSGKKDPLDCLVWMLQRPNEPAWSSSYGLGRPGWHIECTAIALNYLSPDPTLETLIDIQGGGSDLIFPHHEMCAAQARVITGRELASHYVHAGMIGLDGEKMSKSKGNLVFVSSLLASGVDPFSIRWALMSDHFRKDRMWSQEKLSNADIEVKRLRDALKCEDFAPTDNLISCVLESLANDLDTQTIVFEFNKWVDSTLNGDTGGDKRQILSVLENLLGFSTVK